jgi:hypothetical protein
MSQKALKIFDANWKIHATRFVKKFHITTPLLPSQR